MKTSIGQEGKSFPLGATLVPGGANFSVFAKHGTAAQLLLFEDVDAPVPFRVIDLDPRTNRTYHYWHVFVPGVIAGEVYANRIAGLFDPARGLRFDPDKVLLDPYGKCIARPNARSREAARHPGPKAATGLKSIVVDPSAYNWQGDAPLGRPFCAYDHLRDACRRVHPASKLRCASEQTRHLWRVDREDPLSPGPRCQRCRAPPGLCFRRRGRSAGPR